ncbi:MAG: hypothetical protein MR646_02550 [Agathobacter sp.]|nr:hypothetical protein [Agathobacter sp.]MDY4894158.1 hypothetical protein [Agathobacter sp.]
MSGNREYKSDVFSMLMEDKANALQLYNAMNHSDYSDPELVEIHTLDKGVSLSVRNDAAFILDASLSIYEHQSSICPNMPVRCLVYFTNILERLLKKRNIYGRSLIRIPIPKFAVFYNGQEDQPDEYEMRLSDAFEKPVENPELELTCHIYNINNGHNAELLNRCPVLKEYMIFVDYVREYHKREGYENLETAINLAINRCIEENVLKDFLSEHRSEVVKVTQLDYTFDRQIALEREEAVRDGIEIGIKKGIKQGVKQGVKQGIAQGFKQGSEQGFKQGSEQERITAIKNMLSLGVSPELILTKYSEEDYTKATLTSNDGQENS